MKINSVRARIANPQNFNYAKKHNFKAQEKPVDDIYLRLAQASLRDKNIENELKMMGII